MRFQIHTFCLLLILMIVPSAPIDAEDTLPSQDEWLNSQMAPRAFLILASTHDYKTALHIAKQAQKQLNLPLNLRDLKPHKPQVTGDPILSLPQKVCDEEAFGFPCYYPRGRYEDLDYYISIEMTDAYEGLTAGYYFVTAAVTEKGDAKIKTLLLTAKNTFADAYIKIGKVFIGCMH